MSPESLDILTSFFTRQRRVMIETYSKLFWSLTDFVILCGCPLKSSWLYMVFMNQYLRINTKVDRFFYKFLKKVTYNLLTTFIAYEDKEQKYDLYLIAGLFLKKRHIHKVQTRKHIISITKTWWHEIRKLEIRFFFIKYYLAQRSFIILLKPFQKPTLNWEGVIP